MKLALKRFTIFALLGLVLFALIGCKEKTDYTAQLEKAANAILISNSDSITGNFVLPGVSQGATVTWTSSNSDVASIATEANEEGNYLVTITRPIIDQGGANTSVTLTATLTYEGQTYTATKTIRVIAVETEILSTPIEDVVDIAYANTSSAGTDVTFTGIVTRLDGTSFYVQDDTAAIYVYSPSTSGVTIAVGDEVEVSGPAVIYSGLPEITSGGTVTVISSGNTVPSPLTLTDLSYDALKPYLSQMINVNDVYYTDKYVSSSGNYTLYFTANGVDSLTVYLKNGITGFDDMKAIADALVPGQKASFANVILSAYNNPQIVWKAAAEATVGTAPTDAEKATFASLYVPTTLTLESDYTLPTLPYGTLTVKSISSEIASAVADGTTVLTFTSPATNLTGTVVFTVTVGTATVDVTTAVTASAITDADKVAYDADQLTIPATATGYDSFSAPALGVKGSTIVWAITAGATNATLANNTLKIGNGTDSVTVTATVSLNAATPVVKTFTITVTPITLVTDLSTLTAKTGDAWTVATDTYVYVKGVVTGVAYDGTFIQDENGNGLFLYKLYADKVGDLIVAYGKLADYRSARQLASGCVLKQVISSDNTYTITTLTLDQVDALVYSDAGKTFKVTGVTLYSIDSSVAIFKVTTTTSTEQYLRLYYKSFAPWLGEMFEVGDVLPEIQFTLYNIYTTNVVEAGDTFNIDMFAITGLSNEQLLTAAANSAGIPTAITEDTSVTLPSELFGVSLTYESSDSAVFNASTGAVVVTGLTTQVSVTITITASMPGQTPVVVEVVVKVGVTPVSTIAAAFAEVGNPVKIQGVITQLNGNNAFIQDETGAVYVYLGSSTTYASILVVGNKIEVEGTMYNYNDLMEISPVSSVTLVSTGNTLPTPVEVTGADTALLLQHVNELVNVSGLFVKTIPTVGTSSYTIYLTDGTNDLQLRVDKYGLEFSAINALVANLAVGQPVSFTGIAVGVYKGTPQLSWLETAELVTATITDQNKADYDAFKIPATLVLEGDYTFPTLTYATVTAAVSAELTANLTATATGLTFVAPEGSDVTGNVTFTLTVGGVTKDVVVSVTAKAITDAQKLAYDVANLVVPTTAAEYDTVTLPVVGPKGSTVAWVLNTGNATLDAGTLAIGYSGAAFDVTLTATFTLGSEVAQTKDFTIAVSAITVVTDFSTIPAMTDGVALYVQGTVAAIGGSYDGTWLQDASGNGFFLYGYFGSALGDQILVSGTLGSYHSAKQMVKTATLKLTVSQGNTYTYFPLTADEVVALTGDNGGKLVTYTGLEVYSISSSVAVFKVTGTSANIYLKTYITDFVPWVYQLYAVGDFLPTATFAIYNVETSQIDNSVQLKVGAFKVVTTDAEMVEAAIAAQAFSSSINQDITLTLPVATYGVSISWASNNETVINSTTGAVDITSLTATTEVTLTGTFVLNDVTVVHDFVISCVYTEPVSVDWTGANVETFDAFPNATSTYSDGTFTGVNGVAWTYTGARGDSSADVIDGAGVMFGSTAGSMYTTVATGVGSVKIDLRSAFTSTTPRVVELFINDVSYGTYTLAELNTTYTFVVANINISGSVTIKIKNAGGGKQTVIDNFTWTAYSPE